MRIAILSFYSGHVERGVENWTYELGNRLAKKHEVIVFQDGKEQKKVRYKVETTHLYRDMNKEARSLSLLRRIFLDYSSLLIARFTLKMLPRLWKEKFDIVIPTNGGWQVSLVRLVTWLLGSKMVVVGHSGLGWDDRNNLWSFPDRFVALSKRAERWANGANPFIKTTVIPNGVDIKKFTPHGDKAKIKLPPPIIIAVGALESGKRLQLAIEAVSRLKRGSLLILGHGPEESTLRTLAYQLLGDKRFALQQVGYNEMANYYRSAEIFTLPSWSNEAFGMVYLEAMACNLPVVATDDELRHEIVGQGGVLVNPLDSKEYAKALEKALGKKWGTIPRKQAEKFGWDEVTKRYEGLFVSLLK